METRTDTHYRWRGWRIRLPLFLLSIALFVATWRSFPWPATAPELREAALWRFLFWGGAFFLSCVAGLCLEAYLRRAYRCPVCEAALGSPNIDETTREYTYVCDHCQIQWRTMTYRANDSGG